MKPESRTIWSGLPKYAVVGVFVLTVGYIGYQFIAPEPLPGTPNAPKVLANIKVPELSTQAGWGETAFNNTCAACHGKNAGGSENGPPLINDIYNPGHHSDKAFYSAAANGVQSHHWSFGNMPKLADVSRMELDAIIKYIREVQVANGVVYKAHNM